MYPKMHKPLFLPVPSRSQGILCFDPGGVDAPEVLEPDGGPAVDADLPP